MPSSSDRPRTPYPWEEAEERLVLETPEQAVVEYRIAPLGSRFLAALTDFLLLAIVFLLLLVAFALTRTTFDASESTILAGLGAGLFLLQFGYFVFAEFAFDGRTIGKRNQHLRVVRDDGRGITFGAALLRNLARVVDNMPIFWIIPALDKRRRRIGDWIAGTLVVRTDEEGAREFRYDPAAKATATDRRDFHIGTDAAAKLYLDDLNLLEHVFARMESARRNLRRRLARELAAKYVERLGLADQADAIRADPERFLFELFLLLKERHEQEAF